MLRARAILLALVVMLTGAGLIPASGVAANCGGSAGDTQYVDPLACGGGSGASNGGSPATSPPSSRKAGTPYVANTANTGNTSTGVVSAASATASATATTAAAPTHAARAGSTGTAAAQDLPYTGLDIRTLLLLGLGLLAGGLLLRRLVVRGPGG